MRIVLDTNVWLDWLVFDDPSVAALKRAQQTGNLQIVADEACAAELERVLAYEMGKWTLDAGARERCFLQFRSLVLFIGERHSRPEGLPRCSDPDDQKFLELAAAACAHAIVTKDDALLRLARPALPFRIVKPAGLL